MSERETILRLLEERGSALSFPEPALEARFRTRRGAASAETLTRSMPWVLLLYALSGAFFVLISPAERLLNWGVFYAIVGLVMGIAFAFASQISPATYPRLIGPCALMGLIAACVAPQLQDTTWLVRVTSYGAIFCVIATYSLAQLRWTLISAIAWSSGLGVVAITVALGRSMDWLGFGLYFIGSNALGTGLAYIADRQARQVFLQSRLLELEKAELNRLSEELGQLSQEDPLTGLPNRRRFDQRLEEEWRRADRAGRPIAVLFVDIDDFKRYNDRLGHDAGDVCLRRVAQAIGSRAQRAGELAARWGGEEFAMLFPGLDAEEAGARADEVLEAVEALEIAHPEGVAPHVTVSVGVASVVPTPEGSPEDLVRRADVGLYAAKRAGKSRWSLGLEGSAMEVRGVEEDPGGGGDVE